VFEYSIILTICIVGTVVVAAIAAIDAFADALVVLLVAGGGDKVVFDASFTPSWII